MLSTCGTCSDTGPPSHNKDSTGTRCSKKQLSCTGRVRVSVLCCAVSGHDDKALCVYAGLRLAKSTVSSASSSIHSMSKVSSPLSLTIRTLTNQALKRSARCSQRERDREKRERERGMESRQTDRGRRASCVHVAAYLCDLCTQKKHDSCSLPVP